MILTDREIKACLEHGLIDVEPAPDPSAYSSTSLDLTLDHRCQVYKQESVGLERIIDPATPGFNTRSAIDELTMWQEIGPTGFDLEPQRLILAWTREFINLKLQSRLAARVEGKSSLARLGLLVHLTAPTIHAGFSSPIQLEIINLGCRPIRLRPGMPICQLIFEQTFGVAEKGYAGRFAEQGVPGR